MTLTEMRTIMAEEIAKLESRLTKSFENIVKTENEAYKKVIQEQDMKIKKLEDENLKLNKRMNDFEQYSRRSNLQINNIPMGPDESVQNIICEMGLKIGVTIDYKTDIQAAHRVPTSSGLIQPIVVKFSNRQMRNDFLIKAKKTKLNCKNLESVKNLLFSAENKIYVNDHLSPTNKKLFYEARKCVKEEKAKATWTYDGKVYIRRDELSSPILIATMEDLAPFRVSYSSATAADL